LQNYVKKLSLIVCLSLLFLLSANTVNAQTVTDGLVLKYDFVQDTGTTVVDTVNAINGVNSGSTRVDIGNGYYYRNFNGGSNKITIPGDNRLLTSARTYEMLVTFNDITGSIIIFGNSSTNKQNAGLTRNTGDAAGNMSYGFTYQTSGAPGLAGFIYTYNTGVNYLLDAVLYADGSQDYYVNGQLVSHKIPSDGFLSWINVNANSYIGSDGIRVTGKFNISHYSQYNRSLTQNEIKQNYYNNKYYTGPQISLDDTTLTFNEDNIDINIGVSLSDSSDITSIVGYSVNNGSALLGADYDLSSSYLGDIVLIGDSITEGKYTTYNGKNGTAGYLEEKLPGWTITNRGHGGYRSNYIIGNYTVDNQAYHPQYAIILIGTNDIGVEATAEDIEANITIIVNMCLENQTIPILNTIPPANLGGPKNTTLTNVNNWIRGYAAANNIYMVDLWALVVDPDNQYAILPAYTYDNMHFTTAAYELWANSINTSVFTNYALYINAGDTTKNIIIHLLNDGKVSNTKNFSISLNDPVNTTIGTNTTCTINILETGALTFTITASSTSIAEADTTITLTITKNGITDYTESVDLATADGSALAGSDYEAISETVVFTSAEQTKNVLLSIKYAPYTNLTSKSFMVELSNPTGNATLGEPHNLTIVLNYTGAQSSNRETKSSIITLIIIVILSIAAMIIGAGAMIKDAIEKGKMQEALYYSIGLIVFLMVIGLIFGDQISIMIRTFGI
jgi:lysophospholipase L1-like esterase